MRGLSHLGLRKLTPSNGCCPQLPGSPRIIGRSTGAAELSSRLKRPGPSHCLQTRPWSYGVGLHNLNDGPPPPRFGKDLDSIAWTCWSGACGGESDQVPNWSGVYESPGFTGAFLLATSVIAVKKGIDPQSLDPLDRQSDPRSSRAVPALTPRAVPAQFLRSLCAQ